MGEVILTMKGIDKTFPGVHALDHVDFEVRKGDDLVLELPVTVLVLLLVFAFWVCIPLLVIGLFADYHYAFSGAELGRDSVNSAMDKAAEVAEKVKEEVTGQH